MSLKNYAISKLGLTQQTKIVEKYKPSVVANRPETLLEYQAWYNAEEEGLSRFYRVANKGTEAWIVRQSYFWANATKKIRRLTHSGLPKNISDTMAVLLFHNGIETLVNGKEEDEGNETLNAILEENGMPELLNDGAKTESWGSKFAYKLSFDSDISDNTIIELAEPGTYDVVKVRNRTMEIRFNRIKEHMGQKYKIVEVYGFGYIKYEAYFIDKKENEIRVSLEQAGEQVEDFLFEEKIILAAEKTNKTGEGESDYHGLISEFDSLDEAESGLGNDLRKGLARTYTPETRLKQSMSGVMGEADDFENEFTITQSDMREGMKNEITTSQSNIRTAQYKEAINLYIDNILSNVGLNRVTVGLDSTIGANASAEARLQLESTSLRTRQSKIELWTPFLEEFYVTVLKANEIFKKQTVKEYEVQVTFNPYIQLPPLKLDVTEALDLLDSGALKDVNELRKLVGLEEVDDVNELFRSPQPQQEPTPGEGEE